MQTINTYYDNYVNLEKFVIENKERLFAKDNRSVMIQVFCGACSKEYITELLSNIRELIPHAQVIGTTTSGEIMNGSISELQTVLSFSIFEYTDLHVTLLPSNGIDSYTLGQSIAAQLRNERAKLLILFLSGNSINESQLLNGIQNVSPHLPVAGGDAGDQFFSKQSFVFDNDSITDCGVVGIVLESDRLTVNQHCHLCWQPIGKEMTVTKSEGHRVYTIDNIPAQQVYQKYLGLYNTIPSVHSVFPLFSVSNGVETVKIPCLLHDDESIEFLTDMANGEKVRLSFGQIDMIIETMDKLLQKISQQPVESIFVYSCVLRKGFLQDSAEVETSPLQEIAPTAGFFTNGEFYPINDTNQMLHATMTTLVLSELEKTSHDPNSSNLPVCLPDENTNNKDSVKSANMAILKALTNLVNTVTKELSERTNELEEVNKRTRYASIHDPLTGLYNRSFYEEERNRLDTAENSPSAIIMCDVDGLKLVNDTLGHNTGDTVLKAAAAILKQIFSQKAVLARIGGDEFSVILSGRTQKDVERDYQRIGESVTTYNKEYPSVPFSLSVGFAYCKNSFGNMNTLFKEADNNMYRIKLHHSKSIRSSLIKTLLKALEERDIITENHSHRLQDIITAFAEYIGYSQKGIPNLKLLAQFHDIGKVGVPDSILLKAGSLNPKERKEMQRHSEIGFRIAQSSTDLISLADWILKHHEWWNGEGYPLELQKESIPVESRILSIVDAYDAMTNDRPYRKAMSRQMVIKELKKGSGIQFDPVLTEKFIRMLEAQPASLKQ